MMISNEFGKGVTLTPLRANSWSSSNVLDHHQCHTRSQSLMVDHDVMTGGPCGKGGGHVSLPPLTSEPNVHNCVQMFAIRYNYAAPLCSVAAPNVLNRRHIILTHCVTPPQGIVSHRVEVCAK